MNLKQEAQLKAAMDSVGGEPARDSFRIKISWREGANGYPETWAILEGVTTDQLSSPETWLSALADSAGGIYDFECNSSADIRKRIGEGFTIAMNLERAPKTKPDFHWAVLASKTYRGPMKVIYPLAVESKEDPIKLSSAPLTSGPRAPGATDGNWESALQRRETELMVRESEARILAQLNARAPTAAAPQQSSLVGEVAPLVMAFMKEQGEQRRADATAAREERRTQMEADRAARADADKRFEVLLTTLKPPPVVENPIITALLTKAINRDDSAMLKAQSEAMATTTNSMLQILHTKAEIDQMNAPESESPLMRLITKGIDAMVALNGGSMMPPEQPEQPLEGQEQLEAGAEAEAPAAAEEAEEEPLLMQLEKALRKMRPGPEIADLFCRCLKDREFMAVRRTYKDWGPFINARMGVWANESKKREEYMRMVIVEFSFPEAIKRGLMGNRPKPAETAAAAQSPAPAAPGKKKQKPAPKKETGPVEDAVIVEEKPAAAPPPVESAPAAEPKAEA